MKIKDFIVSYKKCVELERENAAIEGQLWEHLEELLTELKNKNSQILDYEEGEDEEELPCVYKSFKLLKWHTQYAGYIFFDVHNDRVGVLLTGYEDDKNNSAESEAFYSRWRNGYKKKFDTNVPLQFYTWNEDIGCFDVVGAKINSNSKPNANSEFGDKFYWGVSMALVDYFESKRKSINKMVKETNMLLKQFC